MGKFKILPECPATPSAFSNNGVGTVIEISEAAAEGPLKNKWIKKVGDTSSASEAKPKKARTRKPAPKKPAAKDSNDDGAETTGDDTKE